MSGPRITHYERMTELAAAETAQLTPERDAVWGTAVRDAAAAGYRQALIDLLAELETTTGVTMSFSRSIYDVIAGVATKRGIDLTAEAQP